MLPPPFAVNVTLAAISRGGTAGTWDNPASIPQRLGMRIFHLALHVQLLLAQSLFFVHGLRHAAAHGDVLGRIITRARLESGADGLLDILIAFFQLHRGLDGYRTATGAVEGIA